MNLSLYTGGVKPYLEYAWVCTPNTGGQGIAANTITGLTMDTEVADTGGFGSIASNQITLAAGTYYYDAVTTSTSFSSDSVFALYNVSTGTYISRMKQLGAAQGSTGTNWYWSPILNLKGQFTVSAATSVALHFLCGMGVAIGAYSGIGNGTAGADQRTTIKLWKLA